MREFFIVNLIIMATSVYANTHTSNCSISSENAGSKNWQYIHHQLDSFELYYPESFIFTKTNNSHSYDEEASQKTGVLVVKSTLEVESRYSIKSFQVSNILGKEVALLEEKNFDEIPSPVTACETLKQVTKDINPAGIYLVEFSGKLIDRATYIVTENSRSEPHITGPKKSEDYNLKTLWTIRVSLSPCKTLVLSKDNRWRCQQE